MEKALQKRIRREKKARTSDVDEELTEVHGDKAAQKLLFHLKRAENFFKSWESSSAINQTDHESSKLLQDELKLSKAALEEFGQRPVKESDESIRFTANERLVVQRLWSACKRFEPSLDSGRPDIDIYFELRSAVFDDLSTLIEETDEQDWTPSGPTLDLRKSDYVLNRLCLQASTDNTGLGSLKDAKTKSSLGTEIHGARWDEYPLGEELHPGNHFSTDEPQIYPFPDNWAASRKWDREANARAAMYKEASRSAKAKKEEA